MTYTITDIHWYMTYDGETFFEYYPIGPSTWDEEGNLLL